MKGIAARPLSGRLLADRRGNFAIMAALTLPLCIMAGGIVVETANSMQLRTRLQAAADAAALATTTGLVEEELTVATAKKYAQNFFRSQMVEDYPDFDSLVANNQILVEELEINHQPVFRVTIDVEASRAATGLARIFGEDTVKVAVHGKSEAAMTAIGAISLAMVLDRSGSMMEDDGHGMPKLVALKLAAKALMKKLDDIDPDKKYVRLGGSSYREYMTGTTPMTWGSASLRGFVNTLPLENGGTESSVAFNWAYKAVNDSNEDAQHDARNGQDPTRIILFMTDGNNNEQWSDVATEQYCNQAKADRIEVFTVALAAPPKGESLLRNCASSTDHFFYADNGADLIAAFEKIGELAAKAVSRLTQ